MKEGEKIEKSLNKIFDDCHFVASLGGRRISVDARYITLGILDLATGPYFYPLSPSQTGVVQGT